MQPTTSLAWRLGFLLVLAPAGCAHQTGALPVSGAPGHTAAVLVAGGGAPPAAAAPGDAATSELVAGDAAGDEDLFDELGSLDKVSAPVADPLAPWNRTMFAFNDKFYFWFLKPAARGYRAVLPRVARTGVDNFINNLWAPRRFVSNLLQLKVRAATIELGKFMINSTWGVLGFGDLFAHKPETTIPEADLGLTLARYGVGGGTYIVWPFFGSFTMRDTAGAIGGLFLDPISYLNPLAASLGGRAFTMVNYTSFRIGDYESFKDASIDPYLAMRDAYLQHRAEKVRESRLP